MIKRFADLTYKAARRIVVGVVGVTVLLLGIIMLVTPGPGLLFIPLGLAILSIEFAWARYWLKRLRRAISSRTASNRGDRAEDHRARATNVE